MKLDITQKQLISLVSIIDDVEAMLGACQDTDEQGLTSDDYLTLKVKVFDETLKYNRLTRKSVRKLT